VLLLLGLLDDFRSAPNSAQQTTALARMNTPRLQGNSVIASYRVITGGRSHTIDGKHVSISLILAHP